MARLTMSEQINSQASEIARLGAVNLEQKLQLERQIALTEELTRALTAARDAASAVPAHLSRIEALEKELANTKSSLVYQTSNADRATSELEQAHAVLDGVPGSPAREYEMDYGKGKRNVVTRLAGAFLAIAQKGQTL